MKSKENILEKMLIKSGTGMIKGFFRLPALIYALDFHYYYTWRRNFEESPNDEFSKENYEVWKEKLQKKGLLSAFDKYYQNQIVNLSTENGKFLGTHQIIDWDDTGADPEFDGTLIVTIKSESGIPICFETKSGNEDGTQTTIGSCLIYIEDKGDNQLPWE